MATPAREPLSCPQRPGTEGEDGDDAQCDGGVVEGTAGNRVLGGEAEDDGDEEDPADGDEGDGFGEAAEVEGAAFEIARPDEGERDGHAVGYVEADGCDGGGSCESDLGS